MIEFSGRGYCFINRKDRVIIQKILGYIRETQQYVSGLTDETFMQDRKTLSACAFTVAQIGELAKEISEETIVAHQEIPWNAMRGMRNKIVHDYENLDMSVLWLTITKSLPELQGKLRNCLFHSPEEIL